MTSASDSRTGPLLPAAWAAPRQGPARFRIGRTASAALLLAPSALILLAFTHWPMGLVAWQSLTAQRFDAGGPPTLGNSARLLADAHIAHACLNNAIYALGTIAPSLLLALLFALALQERTRIVAALREQAGFAEVIARHRQVERIICGHHHRPVTARVAHAIASNSPSVAHQVELDLRPGPPAAFVLESPAYQLHHWSAAHGIVSHTACVEAFPGPYPFIPDPDYPGKAP